MTEEADLYQILGISPDASPADIKKAYRKQALSHHPDRGGDKAAFQALEAAYSILSDAAKRASYDRGEDPADIARLESEAEMALVHCFKLVMGSGARDLIAAAVRIPAEVIMQCRITVASQESQKRMMERRLKRIVKKSEGVNLAKMMIEAELTQLQTDINTNRRSIAVSERVLQMLADYQDVGEAQDSDFGARYGLLGLGSSS